MKEIEFINSKYKKEDGSFYKTIIDDDIYEIIINKYTIYINSRCSYFNMILRIENQNLIHNI
jgi:hypothetical protein